MSNLGLLEKPANGELLWKFRLGQCVYLKDNTAAAEGIVIKRIRTVDGGKLYKILKVFDDEGEHGYASEESIALVTPGRRCVECPLATASVCPRRRLQ